jgi:hypothetical protein
MGFARLTARAYSLHFTKTMTADHQPRKHPLSAPPVPPRVPEAGECCQSGCDPCVYDLYWDALSRYEKALGEWEAANGRLDKP